MWFSRQKVKSWEIESEGAIWRLDRLSALTWRVRSLQPWAYGGSSGVTFGTDGWRCHEQVGGVVNCMHIRAVEKLIQDHPEAWGAITVREKEILQSAMGNHRERDSGRSPLKGTDG